MKQVPVGSGPPFVSAVGLGTNNFGWRLDVDQARELVDVCEEVGIDFLDTADLYGEGRSERALGQALRGRRERFFVATKVGLPWEDGSRPGGLSPDYVRSSVHDSLRRLDTTWIDLLQLHIPDAATPIEDTLAVLADLVDEGSVRHVGCSNFMAWELVEWLLTARGSGAPEFAAIQIEYSMLVRDVETELLPACRRFGVTLIPYRPLAQGFLTGKYRPDAPLPEGARLTLQAGARERRLTSANFAALEAVRRAAARLDCSPGQLAIAWLLASASVGPVIAGASSPGQLRENAAAGDIYIPSDILDELSQALPSPPVGAVGTLPIRQSLRR
jgi:aryl-alcohol dehydrogenase-like predicted oxidoreductase